MGPSSEYSTRPASSGHKPPVQGTPVENTPPPGSTQMPGSSGIIAAPTAPGSLLTLDPAQDQQQATLAAFGMFATAPPPLDPQRTMQRGDEVGTIQRMLSDQHSSTLVLTGAAGAGKSLLAALLYRRVYLARQQGQPRSPRHLVWLTLDSYTTLPDLIAAILKGVGVEEPGFFLLKPEQHVSTLMRALRRSQEPALIILDQFESFLHPEVSQGVAARGVFREFLGLLQNDLGASRIVLTSYQSPFEDKGDESRVRSCLISRITLPEGVTLLQHCGVQCSPEELSLAWQRCTGHVFSLVLFGSLVRLSGIPANVLLNDQQYQSMWGGDVMTNMLTGISHYLNPIQQALLQVLCLFYAPARKDGLITILRNTNLAQNMGMAASQLSAACEHELNNLMEFGLVQPVYAMDGEICYTLHSLLRQFIQEHFVEVDQQDQGSSAGGTGKDPIQVELAAGHVQVAAYYKQSIAQYCPPRAQRSGPLDVEPIIRAVRHYSLGWRWQRACDLFFEEGLHEKLVQWGAWNALLGLYIAMLPPLGELMRRDEGLVASHVAMLYGRLGEHQQSKRYFEQALVALQQAGDFLGEAMTLTNQGELLRAQGEQSVARQNFERAFSLLEKQPDEQLHCILLHNMGLLAQQEKQYEQALYHYTEALQLASQLGKQQYTGMILTNMGMLLYEHEEQREAMALLLAALRLREMALDPSVPLLERFLVALEQKMGSEAYAWLCKEALEIQPLVFSRFAPSGQI